ncbi:MAG: hypothetical protein NC344_07950 [Bacteroidales bacterium]|nr:hypothetical protein [Bacteroidales bacterium]MCM1147747.1 hypothetical protein [Bacteroidales bacterium]MCM1206643.1 hypothetical protein [Bacillota bacterium]MCM1510616.1 hypothetical protein [Clostridium sp.]
MSKIKIFKVTYKNPIMFHEVPLFRGAVINMMKNGSEDILFHNHADDGFRYRYPLVQYKRIRGNAGIIFLGDGIDRLSDFFNNNSGTARIGQKSLDLETDKVEAYDVNVQTWKDEFCYSIRKYLPLNQSNYKKYCDMESVIEKYTMLENILIGNILSFAKGIDMHLEEQVTVKILSVDPPREYRFKGVKMMGFDIQFKTNVSLPDYIGLGKGVSIGFGMIKRLTTK